jgi:hypothetical protein
MLFIQRIAGEFFTLIGTGVLVYALLSFQGSRGCGEQSATDTLFGGGCDKPIVYYFEDDTKIAAALGAVILVAGILILKRANAHMAAR